MLFFLLGPTLFANIADVDAQAEGPGWHVRYHAEINASGAYRSLGTGESDGNRVPPDVARSLNPLRELNTPLFGGGWLSLVFLLGMVLSLRRHDGALFGGAVSFLGLIAVLSIRSGIENQVASVDWPGTISVQFTPALQAIIGTWVLVFAWFIVRGILDRRDERLLLAGSA